MSRIFIFILFLINKTLFLFLFQLDVRLIGKPLPGYPMALPVGAVASASVLLVGTDRSSLSSSSFYLFQQIYLCVHYFILFYFNNVCPKYSHYHHCCLCHCHHHVRHHHLNRRDSHYHHHLYPLFSSLFFPSRLFTILDLHDYSREAYSKTSKMSKDKVLDPSMRPWMGHKYGYEPAYVHVDKCFTQENIQFDTFL